jgi:hypothetical protein
MAKPSLDDRLRAAFAAPADLPEARLLLDHMRFRLGMTYNDCAARLARLVPDLDFEEVCQDIDAMDVDGS